MSQESTTPDPEELPRRLVEAMNRGDIDEYVTYFAPDAVWHTRLGALLEGTAAIRSYHEEFTGSVEDVHFELREFVALGGDVMLTVMRQGGRPGGSTFELHEYVAYVSVVVDGLIESMTSYTDIDEARAAAERLAEERG